MHLVSYLARDEEHIAAVRQRLAVAQPPMALVTARTAPELINQVQSLPVRTILVDLTWPRTTWMQLTTALQQSHPDVPVLALAAGQFEGEWWQYADELLRLEEPMNLFLFRLGRAVGNGRGHRKPAAESMIQPAPLPPMAKPAMGIPHTMADSAPLLENPQFRQFAEIFGNMEEAVLAESFVAWVQQACQTSRIVMLLRDQETGDFVCRAHRGLPSTLIPHCQFPQTSPLCRWLAGSGRILQRDHVNEHLSHDVLADLDLLQAAVAVPIMYDGQLVGLLGAGPRLVGHWYSASELEALFAIGGQISAAVHHCRMHQTIRRQQEMTEHMLSVMPTGAIVLGEDNCIAFSNAAAALILNKPRNMLHGMDLRSLPSPLGDLAYEALISKQELPRRELNIAAIGRPVAVTCYALPTATPSAMLLIEDLSAQRRLEEERERRVNLEVLTNLVHYLAHELRNPLVALSTFSNLMPTHAEDPDFQEFCDSVLRAEVGRVNLILEQLLVLTNHVELQCSMMELAPLIERVTGTEEMRSAVVVSIPVMLPALYADEQRLETALACILRTVTRLAYQESPATVQVDTEERAVIIRVEAKTSPGVIPEWLLNPWQQLMDISEQDVDLGLATAKYIVEEHAGVLTVTVADNVLTIVCRLPILTGRDGREEGRHDKAQSTRR